MKTAAIILVMFAGLIVLGVTGTALKWAFLPWNQLNTKLESNYKIIQKTYDADNQIYNYHWFQERAGAIEATKAQIKQADLAASSFDNLAGDRSKWTFEDKTESARLKAVAQGLRSHYENLVNEYNARANEADRSIFQDGLKTFFPLN